MFGFFFFFFSFSQLEITHVLDQTLSVHCDVCSFFQMAECCTLFRRTGSPGRKSLTSASSSVLTTYSLHKCSLSAKKIESCCLGC